MSQLNILWITSMMLGEGAQFFNGQSPKSGSWVQSLWNILVKQPGLKIALAAPGQPKKGKRILEGEDGAVYCVIPRATDPTAYSAPDEWREIMGRVKPDVIHIHGTEYPYGADWVRTFGPGKVVVSIQGLLSVIARNYLGGIPASDFPSTLRDVLKHDSPKRQQASYVKRGEAERKLLGNVTHIIGRTSWDRAHVKAINPNATYHYGGETLRPLFYERKWSYGECRPHTIFVSQGYYPLKGLHKLIEALPLVLREFPDTKIRLSGHPPFGATKLSLGAYGAYLKKLMKRLGVEDRLEYVGLLDEAEMCQEYLWANLFVLPSAIENSPNSLGEAQMLEMPYLASYVGGTPDLCVDNPGALYRFEEVEMLAEKICDIFRQGAAFKPKAAPRHLYDPDRNLTDLLETYQQIAEK